MSTEERVAEKYGIDQFSPCEPGEFWTNEAVEELWQALLAAERQLEEYKDACGLSPEDLEKFMDKRTGEMLDKLPDLSAIPFDPELVEKLQAKLESQNWHKVSEGLPEEGLDLWFRISTGNYRSGKRRGNYFESSIGGIVYVYPFEEVTHWRKIVGPEL